MVSGGLSEHPETLAVLLGLYQSFTVQCHGMPRHTFIRCWCRLRLAWWRPRAPRPLAPEAAEVTEKLTGG